MVDTKTLGLAEATALADDDAIMVVDISDTTMDPTGTNKFMEKANLSIDLGIDQLNVFAGNSLSTGWNSGGVVSINGGDAATFDVALGAGLVVDSHTDPANPVVTLVSWGALSAEVHLTGNLTFIGITSAGALTTQQTNFTSTQRRDIIVLGSVVHSGGLVSSTIELASADVNIVSNPHADLVDFANLFGAINTSGNVYSANGANLNIDVTAGEQFQLGNNSHASRKNPNFTTQGSDTAVEFTSIYQDGSGGFTLGFAETAIDPDFYDDGSGTLVALANNRWVIHRIYRFEDESTIVTYGQVEYANYSDAVVGVNTEQPVLSPNLSGAALRSYLIVQESATDLSNASEADFVTADNLIVGTSQGGGAMNVIIVQQDGSPVNGTSGVIDFQEGFLATDGGSGTADLNLAQATENAKGGAELATQAEAEAGTDDLRIMTPLGVQQKIDDSSIAFTASRFIGSLSGDTAYQDLTPAELRTTADVPLRTQSIIIPIDLDISAGNGDYIYVRETNFPFTIDDLAAVELDIGTATVTLKINTTVVTGISVSASTTRLVTPDAASAANDLVVDDDLVITVASVASSPTRLTGSIRCTKVLDK